MINIIIALNASKGRDKISLLIAGGGNYNILPSVLSGADIIKTVRRYGGKGVVICGETLSDMHYTHLTALLEENYKVLLIKSSGSGFYEKEGNMAMLIIPFSAGDLMASIESLCLNLLPKRPDKLIKRATLEEAKAILMERNNMSEPQAHRFIQKRSMDIRTDINAIAEEIIRLYKKI